jgi:hypothetical protein
MVSAAPTLSAQFDGGGALLRRPLKHPGLLASRDTGGFGGVTDTSAGRFSPLGLLGICLILDHWMGSAFISKKLCELSKQVLVAPLAAGRIV